MARTRARPVVIDTDPGVDDALAILLALRSPELDVVGITTVCGNVSVTQATDNLYRVLQVVKPRTTLLVGQGAAKPIGRALTTATHVHGSDGLGELDRFVEPDGRLRYPPLRASRRLPGAFAVWDRCARRSPGELTLITLGPLTNLALALDRCPSVVRRFRSIIAMAGAIGCPGNVSAAAEFNVYVDPEAAQRVLQAELPLTLIPLDVTERVAMSGAQIARETRKNSDRVARFLRDATGHALAFARQVEGCDRFPFHDPLAVAAAVDPSLIRRVPLRVEVETRGRIARGATVADRRPRRKAPMPSSTVNVAMEVHVGRALTFLKNRLCRASS